MRKKDFKISYLHHRLISQWPSYPTKIAQLFSEKICAVAKKLVYFCDDRNKIVRKSFSFKGGNFRFARSTGPGRDQAIEFTFVLLHHYSKCALYFL